MLLEILSAAFNRKLRLPRDTAARIPRRARKAATASTTAIQAVLDRIAAMPGIADIPQSKRVPRGFYAAMDELLEHVDAYHGEVRKHLPIASDVKRPGEPGGTAACYEAPMGVHAIEQLNIYRTIRTWRDFRDVATRLAELTESLFKEIQAGHTGREPDKIRMGGKAVREGRLRFVKQMHPCPFLDQDKERCRIWEARPLACRMHFPISTEHSLAPDAEGYPTQVKAKNIRLPVKAQLVLGQLDKRMQLETSPFLYGGPLQLLQLSEGNLIQEVGEAPQRMQQDGQIVQRANRNVRHAKKFQKAKKSGKPKKRK